jgi:hypothetical protein
VQAPTSSIPIKKPNKRDSPICFKHFGVYELLIVPASPC